MTSIESVRTVFDDVICGHGTKASAAHNCSTGRDVMTERSGHSACSKHSDIVQPVDVRQGAEAIGRYL